MSFIYGLILGLIVGGAVGYLVKPKNDKIAESDIKTVYMAEDEVKKKENLAKIESYIVGKEKFTNDELQNMLGVANTTVKRYLDELEAERKIKQIGDTGSGVYYTKS